MRATAFVLSCIACAQARQSSPSPLQSLATLLQASSPEAGWQLSGAGAAANSQAPRQVRSVVAMNGIGKEDESRVSRRSAVAQLATVAGMASMLGAMPALAKDDDDDDSGVKAPPLRTDAVLQAPDKYEFGRKYKADTKLMIDNMKIVTDMGRGTPQMEDIAKATRKQMINYISLYRARPETTKLPSFSVMYTAINTVAGHYASYGYKYPIPEKRRVRLAEQYLEVERALARGK
mmetsp:Transcript_97383/g.183116  ORF Transcript_97383/g.183116 Transcript_97383/m.183116 type:complete len:234 (+) Transcript_97383:65-766(+)